MTFVADIPARRAPAHRAEPLDREQRIAVAEIWLCMLRALAEIGARFVEFLTPKIAPAKGGPRWPMMVSRFVGNPVAAFVRVDRAVRLALLLTMRIEDEIDHLKAGEPLGPESIFRQAPTAKAERATELSKAVRKRPPLGDEEMEAARQEIAGDVENPEPAENLIDKLEADLLEDAAFCRLLNGPLKDAVAAICAGLGLKPDWGMWTQDGFPPPPGGEEEDWINFFVPAGDTGPAPPPERPPPQTPPRACVRDPRHLLDPPRRDLNAFLAAHGIKPLPPPPDQRRACKLPRFVLRQPRGGAGLPTSLYS